MLVTKTKIEGVVILEPKVFLDERGWFMESWSDQKMKEAGLDYQFVQDNESFSIKRGILRGLHFQKGEAAQAKLVRCGRGGVLDVAVDLRKGSKTFLMWVAVELTGENHRQLLLPRGMAHGFLTLTDDVQFLYRTDHPYCPQQEGAIRYNDPDIGIEWGIEDPILLEKDRNAPWFREVKDQVVYG